MKNFLILKFILYLKYIMQITEQDKVFYAFMYKFIDILRDVNTRSLRYNMQITEENYNQGSGKIIVQDKKNKKDSEHTFIIINMYDFKKELFIWNTRTREVLYPKIVKFLKAWGLRNLDPVNKLFANDEFFLEAKYSNIVGILITLLYNNFNAT